MFRHLRACSAKRERDRDDERGGPDGPDGRVRGRGGRGGRNLTRRRQRAGRSSTQTEDAALQLLDELEQAQCTTEPVEGQAELATAFYSAWGAEPHTGMVVMDDDSDGSAEYVPEVVLALPEAAPYALDAADEAAAARRQLAELRFTGGGVQLSAMTWLAQLEDYFRWLAYLLWLQGHPLAAIILRKLFRVSEPSALAGAAVCVRTAVGWQPARVLRTAEPGTCEAEPHRAMWHVCDVVGADAAATVWRDVPWWQLRVSHPSVKCPSGDDRTTIAILMRTEVERVQPAYEHMLAEARDVAARLFQCNRRKELVMDAKRAGRSAVTFATPVEEAQPIHTRLLFREYDDSEWRWEWRRVRRRVDDPHDSNDVFREEEVDEEEAVFVPSNLLARTRWARLVCKYKVQWSRTSEDDSRGTPGLLGPLGGGGGGGGV